MKNAWHSSLEMHIVKPPEKNFTKFNFSRALSSVDDTYTEGNKRLDFKYFIGQHQWIEAENFVVALPQTQMC